MMMYLKLSEVPDLTTNEVIDFLLDRGATGIINDLTPEPQIEYALDDLLVVWERINNKRL